MKLIVKPLADLTAAPYNPRTISVAALEGLRASIDRFGLVAPVVWNERTGHVVGGHQRIKAMEMSGGVEVPVVVVDLPETEEKALNVTLNNPGIQGEFTPDVLPILDELEELDPEGFADLMLDDIRETDFGGNGGGAVDIVEDEVPEPPGEAVTKPGDLWVLGRHRLLCGDATKAEDVERLMDGKRADMIFTDPPYGVDYSAMRMDCKIKGDGSFEEAKRLVTDALCAVSCRTVFACCSWRSMPATIDAMVAAQHDPKACIVWDKGCGVQNLDRYYKRHEFLLYAGPYGGQCTVDGDVWNIPRDFNPAHPTPKPVELPARAMATASMMGEFIFDPFGGSGTTLIAAEQLDRTCYMMEIEPGYCDVVVERWQNLTGEKAHRE